MRKTIHQGRAEVHHSVANEGAKFEYEKNASLPMADTINSHSINFFIAINSFRLALLNSHCEMNALYSSTQRVKDLTTKQKHLRNTSFTQRYKLCYPVSPQLRLANLIKREVGKFEEIVPSLKNVTPKETSCTIFCLFSVAAVHYEE